VSGATHVQRLPGQVALRASPPVAAWLAATALLLVTAAAAGYSPFEATTWSRWDSEHYLSIAAEGYRLEPCAPGGPLDCGNAGWFPAYPWLVGALAVPPLTLEATALAVSWLFALATLILLSRTFLREGGTNGLVFAAFAPGLVYLHSVFPLSMLTFFTVLALWLLTRERWAAAGAATAVAAATYHLGVLLIPVAVVYALVRGGPRRALIAGGIGALGPAVTVLAMRLQTGAWDAFLRVQEQYSHELQSPVLPLRNAFHMDSWDATQTVFVTAVVLAVTLHTLHRRDTATPADWLLLGTTLVLWIVPLAQFNVGLYRTAATLVPAAVLVARLPKPLGIAACAGAAYVAMPVTLLFLDGWIV
jgi:hypothetical protein